MAHNDSMKFIEWTIPLEFVPDRNHINLSPFTNEFRGEGHLWLKLWVFVFFWSHKYGNFHMYLEKHVDTGRWYCMLVRLSYHGVHSMDHTASKSPGPIRPSLWGHLFDMWFLACNSLIFDWFTAYKSSHSRLLLYKRASPVLGWSF